MYFWEDDDEMSPKRRAMQTLYDTPEQASAAASTLPPSSMTRQAPAMMGVQGMLPMMPAMNLARGMASGAYSSPAPTGNYGPSGGWNVPNTSPNSGAFSLMEGRPLPYLQNGPVPEQQGPVGRVWTEADLEPLSVGSFGGFNFARQSTPFTQANPNLPLFRADMAQRAQGLNFAAELAASNNRMNFQAGENEQDRMLKRELAGDSNAMKKDQALAFLADPNIPQNLKDIKSQEAIASGKITPQQAGTLKLGQILSDASKAGLKPDSLEFWKYVSGNYDPNTMSNLDLIAQLQKMNIPASTLAQIADPVTNNSNLGGAYQTIRNWTGASQNPDEIRARNFARSLLSR